jgi:hypothetical protein
MASSKSGVSLSGFSADSSLTDASIAVPVTGSLTWNGGSGDWSTASNWSVLSGSDLTPGALDDATINASGTYVVTVSGAQAVNNLTLDAPGATLAIVGGPAGGAGTLAVGGSLTGGGGTLDLTHGGLTFANSETLDNLAISFINPLTLLGVVPFTLGSGVVLTLGPHVVMTGQSNPNPIAFMSQGGTVVNEGTITTPGTLAAVSVSSSLDNEGSINIGYAFGVGGDLTNNGEISFTIGQLPDALNVNGNVLGLGRIVIPSFAGLAGAPITVTGTLGPQELIGPINAEYTVTAKAVDPGALFENFFAGSTIDLTGLAFSSNLEATYHGSTAIGSLNITNNGSLVASMQFRGIPASSGFDLTSDGHGGTFITTGVPIVPCFVTGTRIRTARGEVAVEELRVGDRVPTVRAGAALPVVWIGRREVQASRHPCPEDVHPVRVAAGAFADFVPLRELWLSPEHCVFLHGVLVPIRVLVNGTSIVQVPCERVTYWHVELESHDLMLCEGAWAESYLDMGNRAAFTGVGEAQAPDFSRAAWEARACQQQERGGPIVVAIRAAIDARARRAA